jgi:hypothetical protein
MKFKAVLYVDEEVVVDSADLTDKKEIDDDIIIDSIFSEMEWANGVHIESLEKIEEE